MPSDNFQKNGLDAAYRATRYVVDLPGGAVVLRVGQSSLDLDRWLAAQGADCWAWLTADNPGSRRLSAADNAGRREALAAALAVDGRSWQSARAVPDDPEWPEEDGVLVPNLPKDGALALAARFGQNAVLCGRPGAATQLVWLPGKP